MEPIESLLDALTGPANGARVSDGAGRSLDTAALVASVRSLAARLTASGCRTLALHRDNGPDWVIADLAARAAGICLVPLPTFFSAAQIRHILSSVPVDAILSADPAALAPRPVRSAPVELPGAGAARLLRIAPTAAADVLPPGTGKVTFTSGSTGRPKGVCLGNAQLLRQARVLAAAAGLERPRHLCVLPLSTLLENVGGVYAPLLAAGEVLVPPLAEVGFEGSSALDHRRFVATISRYRPHSLILTPQLLQVLVLAARGGWAPPSSLAFVAVGGARVPAGLIEAAHARGIPAYEGYGLSECASVVSLNRPGAARPGTCGRPLPHVTVDIVDGEIRVAGNAMLGYAGEPDSWGQERIATGDLGALDADGFLRIEGRVRNLLISSYGRNISPEWVESELLADGRLGECVVFGDARPHCVALLRPRAPELDDATIQTTIDTANRGLPDYARVRAWRRLPEPLAAGRELLTENGRPRRPAIEARYGSLIDSLYPEAASIEHHEERIA
ncbi:MAG: AMP-binding protein [Xanthomonadales bacterium]